MKLFYIISAIFLFTLSGLSAKKNKGEIIVIKGKIDGIDQTSSAIPGFVSCNGTTKDINLDGSFILETSKHSDLQVFVHAFCCRQIKFINLPMDKDTIELGALPMFGKTKVFISYNCRTWNPLCKYWMKRNARGIDKHSKVMRKEINKEIANYNYIFENKKLQINFNNKSDLLLIDLKH